MDRYDEIQSCENRRKPVDEDPQSNRHHIGVGKRGAVRHVKCPTGIHAALHQSPQCHYPPCPVEIKTQKIDTRERKILCADHQRNKKITQDSRDRRYQEEKDHQDTVLGKYLVICSRLEQIACRREQFQSDSGRVKATHQKEQRHGDQIHYGNALVVLGQ